MSGNCGCEPKRYNLSLGCCVPVLAPIENYYTKSQVDKLIEDIEVSGVTEEEVDEKISSATSGMATEEFVSGYTYDKQTIDEKDAEKVAVSAFTAYSGTVSSELSGKASQSSVDTLSGDIQSVSAQVQTIVSGEVTSAEVQTMIEGAISGKTNESDFTAHTANTTVHVTSAQTATWDAKPNVWIGDETAWGQISGNTQNGVIYLVY